MEEGVPEEKEGRDDRGDAKGNMRSRFAEGRCENPKLTLALEGGWGGTMLPGEDSHLPITTTTTTTLQPSLGPGSGPCLSSDLFCSLAASDCPSRKPSQASECFLFPGEMALPFPP